MSRTSARSLVEHWLLSPAEPPATAGTAVFLLRVGDGSGTREVVVRLGWTHCWVLRKRAMVRGRCRDLLGCGWRSRCVWVGCSSCAGLVSCHTGLGCGLEGLCSRSVVWVSGGGVGLNLVCCL